MDINVSLVKRLIAGQFPKWAHLPIRPVEFSGWDNRTFRLGDEMTVRLPSAQAYAAQVDKEQQWLPKLAPLLPLAIPLPLAMGVPSREYPWRWSVYGWIAGENASADRIANMNEFADELSKFLHALQHIDANGGPPPGPHNFYRGDSLTVYDGETRTAIADLRGTIDADAATAVWENALDAVWTGLPVWLHGDIHPTNLLVQNGRLRAVIDFGCSAVGDAACDYAIAWTFFSGKSRERFRAGLGVDDAAWSRARGWALWKACITLADPSNTNPSKRGEARRTIDEILVDYLKMF